MRRKTGAVIALAILFTGLLMPFSLGSPEKPPLVVASIAPLASIVQDAFGDSVNVVYIIPLGGGPPP